MEDRHRAALDLRDDPQMVRFLGFDPNFFFFILFRFILKNKN